MAVKVIVICRPASAKIPGSVMAARIIVVTITVTPGRFIDLVVVFLSILRFLHFFAETIETDGFIFAGIYAQVLGAEIAATDTALLVSRVVAGP
jgi:hypothetical protein